MTIRKEIAEAAGLNREQQIRLARAIDWADKSKATYEALRVADKSKATYEALRVVKNSLFDYEEYRDPDTRRKLLDGDMHDLSVVVQEAYYAAKKSLDKLPEWIAYGEALLKASGASAWASGDDEIENG